MTSTIRITTAIALAAFLAAPPIAHAQDQKVRVSFGAGATAGSIDGGTMFTGSAGYQFAKQFSFDVEVSGTNEVPDRLSNRVFASGIGGGYVGGSTLSTIVGSVGNILGGQRDNVFGAAVGLGIPILPNISADTDGSTLLMTIGVRYEVPTMSDRFRPYLGGGMGISRTDETLHIESFAVSTAPGRPGAPQAPTGTLLEASMTHTGLLGSAGGGASLRVFKQLWLDLDARYYFLDRDTTIGRFGGGVSYRF